jgi:hypothetical protein
VELHIEKEKNRVYLMVGRIAAALLALLAVANPAGATVPAKFTVQGILRDGQGVLQTMAQPIGVKIYDSQAKTTVLFSQDPDPNQPIVVSNGLFSFPVSVPNDKLTKIAAATQLWLEVTAGTDTFPVQQITPVISSLMCGTADNASNAGNASQLNGQAASYYVDTANNQTIQGVKNFGANVGIGTTSPLRPLHIARNDSAEIVLDVTNGAANRKKWNIVTDNTAGANFYVRQLDDSGSPVTNFAPFLIDANANVGVGQNLFVQGTVGVAKDINASGNLSVGGVLSASGNLSTRGILIVAGADANSNSIGTAGNINAGANLTAALDVYARGQKLSSDSRLKMNVRTIENALDKVQRLRGVTFDWKADGKHSTGIIAQEVEKVFPELVSTGPNGFKAVEYSNLVGVLIEATKQLRAEQTQAETAIRQLQADKDRLRAELKQAQQLRTRLERVEQLVGPMATATRPHARKEIVARN